MALLVLQLVVAMLLHKLKRQHWWGILRVGSAVSASIRLLAVAILYVYVQPATYPPGSLSLHSVMLVPINSLVVIKLLSVEGPTHAPSL